MCPLDTNACNRFWALGGQHRSIVRKKLIDENRKPDGTLPSPWDVLLFTPAQIVVGLEAMSAGQVYIKICCFVTFERKAGANSNLVLQLSLEHNATSKTTSEMSVIDKLLYCRLSYEAFTGKRCCGLAVRSWY